MIGKLFATTALYSLYLFSIASSMPAMDIIGGQPVNSLKYPWMGYIRSLDNSSDYDGQFCGASAIGDRYVLTAAHCVKSALPEQIELVFGEYKMSSNDGKYFDVDNIYTHPNYSLYYMYDSDIAVLKLKQSLILEQYATLNDNFTLSYTGTHTAVGWGLTSLDSVGDSRPDVLNEVYLQAMDRDKCTQFASMWHYAFTTNMMCAFTKDKDTCYGDSGGPVFQMKGSVPVITGITSFGLPNGCAFENEPGFYANVYSLKSWILSIVVQN